MCYLLVNMMLILVVVVQVTILASLIQICVTKHYQIKLIKQQIKTIKQEINSYDKELKRMTEEEETNGYQD